MMVYVPEEFLTDKSNMEEVHNILSLLDNDLVEEDLKNEVVKKLKDLGELKIIEKLVDGFFSFGA